MFRPKGDLADKFGDQLNPVSRHTYVRVIRQISNFKGYMGWVTPRFIAIITPEDISNFFEALMLKNTSEKSLIMRIYILKRFFKWTLEKGYVEKTKHKQIVETLEKIKKQIRPPQRRRPSVALASSSSSSLSST